MPTRNATMQNYVRFPFFLYANGLHHTFTCSLPITRTYINMLAPKALRAVIGIPVTDNFGIAIFASEMFFCAGK